MRKNLFYLKNVVIVVGFIHAATLVKAQNTQHVVEKIYFPSAQEWQVKSPQFFKIDSLQLNEAIQFSIQNETKYPRNPWLTQAMQFGKEPFSDPVGPMLERGGLSGIVIYKGYIIAKWGDPSKVESCNSVTKSFVSSTIGLAYERGLIRSLEDKVYTYLPPIETAPFTEETKNQNPIDKKSFIFPFDTPHNQKISWDNLLRQTSDWEGTLWGKPDWADRPNDKPQEWLTRTRNEPGSTWKYNDTRVNAIALAATLVWHRPLPEVLRELIMDPIGSSNTWHWTGYRNSWIVLDGKVIQSVSGGGHFGGGMFISAMDMARFGLLSYHKGNWNGKQLIPEKWIELSTTPTSANTGYGFMNYFLNTDKKLLPSAPEDVFVHIGNGTNMIYVDRKNELVAVVRWIDNAAMDGFVSRMLSSLNK